MDWVRGDEPAAALKNITKLFNDANQRNGEKGEYRVQIPSDFQPMGTVFDVTLVAENFLGESDQRSVRVKKLRAPAPTVHVAGENPRTGVISSGTTELQTVAALPEVACLNEGGERAIELLNKEMVYKWSELTRQLNDSLVETFVTKSPTILEIPPYVLQPLSHYEFQLVVMMEGDDPASEAVQNNSVIVEVDVIQQNLVSHIAGGEVRQQGQVRILHA